MYKPYRHTYTSDAGPKLDTPTRAAEILNAHGVHAGDVESFTVVTLDASHRAQTVAVVSTGTANACLVHPRDVYRLALEDNACAVLVAHNHPSGNTAPSGDDLELTRRLAKVGNVMGIVLLDHVILAANGKSESIRETNPETLEDRLSVESGWVQESGQDDLLVIRTRDNSADMIEAQLLTAHPSHRPKSNTIAWPDGSSWAEAHQLAALAMLEDLNIGAGRDIKATALATIREAVGA